LEAALVHRYLQNIKKVMNASFFFRKMKLAFQRNKKSTRFLGIFFYKISTIFFCAHNDKGSFLQVAIA